MNAMIPVHRLTVQRRQGDEPLTDIDFCAWVAQALPGDVLEYHRGVLAIDRDAKMSCLGADECERIDHLADRVYAAFEQDLVVLVQDRVGPYHYRYLAVARPKPEEPSHTILQLLMPEAA